MSYIEDYYNGYDEEGRLLSKHGQVEFLTTMKYIKDCISKHENPKILEVGAGTGRYSVTLAKQGEDVTAVELIPHNLEILKSKLDGSEKLDAILGNATDLSALPDATFDITMLLGPMYHLYNEKDKIQALSEAMRVTKPGGHILVAYCMNEPTIVQYVFWGDHLKLIQDNNMVTPDWHCISEPKDLFELVRIEDINALNSKFPLKREKLIATDGFTNYNRDCIDEMSDDVFSSWMDYHFTICERQDLIGMSHHTLDILRK